MPKKKNEIHVFTDIEELLTLKGVESKHGRGLEHRDLGFIGRAALVAHNDRIVWVGKQALIPLAKIKSQLGVRRHKEISLRAQTVMPAFVECHTHMIHAGDRSHEFEMRNQGATYQEIAKAGGGILSTMSKTRKASHEELLETARQREARFVKQGVTTLEIKSGYAMDLKNEIKMLEVAGDLKRARIVRTFLGAHAVPKKFESADAYLDTVINKMLPKITEEKLADRVDIFVEKGYFYPQHLDKLARAVRKAGLGLCAHVEQLSRSGGAEMAIDLNAQSVEHVIEINSRDIKKLANSDTTSVLLPAADFYLQCKYPPARKLIDEGARVALATDFNPGSAPTQDLSFVGVLARLEMKMKQFEVIAAYTWNAAKALGRELEVGSLVPGKLCDFIVLDGDWKDLFYQVGHHPVSQVWKGARRISAVKS